MDSEQQKMDTGEEVPPPDSSEEKKDDSSSSMPPPPPMSFKKPLIFGPRPGLKKVQKKNILDDEEKNKDKNTENKQNEEKKPEKSSTESKQKHYDAKASKPKEQAIPYKEPAWSGLPKENYNFEVLKGGIIADTIDLSKKAFHVFGRLPSCDITMEHPSLSRYHAVLQYCAVENEKHGVGWYIYDLDSTHGTWANKAKLNPNTYYRLRVGHVVKFGGSTRLHILQGPDEDQEEESEFSVSELKHQKEIQEKELEVLRHAEEMKKIKVEEDTGCSWGMDDEAVEEDEEIGDENPFAELTQEQEELYIDDPKKALRGYFEREGLELPEYEVQENSFGKYKCVVELPIDDAMGRPIMAEAVISGKKKDAVAQCALEACRILDKHGVLRQAKHESRKRKKKNWEDEDFYDSDDDSFLDRTGTIEKKRKERMKRAGKLEQKVETFDSLTEKMDQIMKDIAENEKLLEKAKAACQSDDIDDLDAYVNSIKSGQAMDSKTRMKIKRTIFDLKQEQQKVQKLINVARPANLPPSKPLAKPKEEVPTQKKAAALFGKKLHKPVSKPVLKPVGPVVAMATDGDVEEEEDDDDEKEAEKTGSEENPSSMEVEESVENSRTSAVTQKSVQEKETPKSQNKEKNISKTEASPKASPGPPTKRQPTKKPAKAAPSAKRGKEPKVSKKYCESDPDYDLWMPPTGQSGDGTTSLNAKFGY